MTIRLERPLLEAIPSPLAQVGYIVQRSCLQCDHQVLTTWEWQVADSHICDDGAQVVWPVI